MVPNTPAAKSPHKLPENIRHAIPVSLEQLRYLEDTVYNSGCGDYGTNKIGADGRENAKNLVFYVGSERIYINHIVFSFVCFLMKELVLWCKL